MKSLRGQLLLYLMAALLVSSAVVAVVTYRNAKEEIDEMFDANLAQIAATLKAGRSSYSVNMPSLAEHPQATQVASEADFIVQIWSNNGILEYASHPHIPFPLQQQREWSTVLFQGERWRVYKKLTENNTVQVSQLLKERMATIEEIVISIMMPQLVFIPLFGLLIWLAVGRTMRPLAWVSMLITKRGPNAMEPIEENNIPVEIKPLTEALNSLLKRLSDALTTQRQFVADAAHELRTPLTALTLQLNMIERARDATERAQAIALYKSGLDRSIHLVQQLLTLARMEPEVDSPIRPVKLASLINVCVSQFIAFAEEKSIDLGIKHIEDSEIDGDFDALRIMFGNLLDNAIRYTPAGGKIDVILRRTHESILLEVEDTGPGIPNHEYERVFDRFYRGASKGVRGTGLGLPIVKAIVEKHNARLTLAQAPIGGLKASIAFPVKEN